jgi:hypothetical protein
LIRESEDLPLNFVWGDGKSSSTYARGFFFAKALYFARLLRSDALQNAHVLQGSARWPANPLAGKKLIYDSIPF